MTVLSAQSIHRRWGETNVRVGCFNEPLDVLDLIIEPFFPDKRVDHGMSYGLTAAGYDIRIGEMDVPCDTRHLPPGHFALFASLERIRVPTDLQVIVHDKSSWARKGLALQNTVLEPGWEGHITLELSNHSHQSLTFYKGMPIAQLIFHQLDAPTCMPYNGKYQNQGAKPVQAIEEKVDD